jgi:outer membrane protein OmpA-like peptidoglycan-associated protein
MHVMFKKPATLALIGLMALPLSSGLVAQQSDPSIVVTGEPFPDISTLPAGPELKGVITARNGDKIRVTGADGSSNVVAVGPATKVRASGGLFGGNKGKPGIEALLNGLPVTVKTVQGDGALFASQVSFKNSDLKTATMIRNGTSQRFGENEAAIEKNAAAAEALRSRMADIDKYNVKSTMNVYFDTGKWALSPQAKSELCATATEADALDNALMLVVGYTDSVGSEEYNQVLSERRASSVINYLQQACRWKPYRMLTPTGMAESDPLADNSTAEGRAQNRRVSVNVLVSKALDGM